MKAKAKNEMHILIVENEKHDEAGTRGLLTSTGYEHIESASNLESAQALLAQLAFDFVIVDLEIPPTKREDEREKNQSHGFDLIDDIKVSQIPQIILSQWATAQWILPALERGIGYIRKGDIREGALLDHAIHVTINGGVVYSSTPQAILQSLTAKTSKRSNLYDLSHRERQVVYLYAYKFNGGEKSDEKVARVLVIEPDTAAKHRKNAMEKLNLHSAAELVSWALRNPHEFSDVKDMFKDVPESE